MFLIDRQRVHRFCGATRLVAALFALAIVLASCGSESYSSDPQPNRTPASQPLPSNVATRTPRSVATSSSRDPGTGVYRTELPPGNLEVGEVTAIVDGDTIEVRLLATGTVERVRFISVNTPEYDECFGDDAARTTSGIIPAGTTVWLQRVDRDRDKYDRLLRHVWHREANRYILVEYELVRDGFAFSHDYGDGSPYMGEIEDVMVEAQADQRGLWGACELAAIQEPDSRPAAEPIGIVAGQGSCSPGYPEVCIPLAPPDLDCGDITFRRFQVLPPDPHRFDSDRDGVGCEGG